MTPPRGEIGMTAAVFAFLAEIREKPALVTASAVDPMWAEHLFAIERGIDELCRDDRPEAIEIVDKIHCVIARKDHLLKDRLLDLGKLLVQARDIGRSVH
jgi:hypothetical protein